MSNSFYYYMYIFQIDPRNRRDMKWIHKILLGTNKVAFIKC